MISFKRILAGVFLPIALGTVARPAGAEITLVQTTSTEGSGVGSVSASFSADNAAGNLIIAFVRMSTTTQTVQITDSLGNTYNQAVTQAQSTDGHQIYIFYAKNIAGGANTVQATFSATNNHPWLAIYEYSGLSTTSPLDQVAAAQGSSSTPSTNATNSTTSANELVFVGAGFVNTFTGTVTAEAGYTLSEQDTGSSRAANETYTTSSTGSFTGKFTLGASTNWSAALATFKPAGTPESSSTRGVGILFDGQGSALVSGQTLYYAVPFGCTIQGWDMTVDAGTATIDVWKVPEGSSNPTSANSITGTNTPEISQGQHISSANVAGWNTLVNPHDDFGFYLKAVSGATKASLVLQCQ